MNSLPKDKLRPIFCWNCGIKFLLDPKLSEGKCPNCKSINEIFLEYANLPDEIREVLTVVKCNNCLKKIITSKVSEYVVCPTCKSSLLIERTAINKPSEYNHLTDMEYFILLAKLYSFNPYLMPDYSEYHLQPNFEKTIVSEHKNTLYFNQEEFKKRKLARAANDAYSQLFDVISKNEREIKSRYLNDPNKKGNYYEDDDNI